MAKWISSIDNELNNLSVVFLNRNVKNYLILAIKSFLHFYPELKNNIIVFDDDSVDGSVDWLKKENITILSPSKNIKFKHSHGTRVGLVVNNLLNQIQSKYLFISDSDVAFKQKDFLLNYMGNIDKYKVFARKIIQKISKRELKEKYEEYKILVNQEDYEKSELDNRINIPRIPQYHIFCDLEYLKQYNIHYHIKRFNDNRFDNGHEFLYQLIKNNISHKVISKEDENKIITHFGFITAIYDSIHFDWRCNEEAHNFDYEKYLKKKDEIITSNKLWNDIKIKYNLNFVESILE
ncbi:MAG: glycosyltransferase [archaeon]